MPLTDATANAMLDHWFGSADPGVPATWYVGLSTTAPAADGSNVTEPSGGAYAPVAVPNDSASWGPAAGRGSANLVDVQFPEATAGWGTLTHWVLKDGAAGTVRAHGALAAPRTVPAGLAPRFVAGTFTITSPAAT